MLLKIAPIIPERKNNKTTAKETLTIWNKPDDTAKRLTAAKPKPVWEHKRYERFFLKSFWNTANTEQIKAEVSPKYNINLIAKDDKLNIGNILTAKYSPVTTVEDEIKAFAGIGVSFVSVNHIWKGNWADFIDKLKMKIKHIIENPKSDA